MSPLSLEPSFTIPRFPRVSGDEPNIEAGTDFDLTFSPRERG